MSRFLQLSIAGVCALAAAIMNWVYLSSQSHPPSYVAFANNVGQGQTLEADDLMAIPIPGDADRLKQTLIPYSSRAVLLGTPAERDYERGDLFFARDVSPPSEQQGWDVIGPFELISVGERFKQTDERGGEALQTTRGDTVTIAVSANFDRQTSRLLAAIAPPSVFSSSQSTGRDELNTQIVAVQVVPSKQSRRSRVSGVLPTQQHADDGNDLTNNSLARRVDDSEMVYQTVALHGIANVPAVLLEGDFIRFVVPVGSPQTETGSGR